MAFLFDLVKFIRWGILLLTLSLTTACATYAQPELPLTQNIDAVDIQRLELAQTAIEKISRDWQLDTRVIDKTCIILFGDQREWILNCSEALIGDAAIVSEFRGKPVYFTPNSLSIPSATKPYLQMASSVVAEASVWTPYQQKLKEINQPPVILIQKLEDLMIHHLGFPKETTKTEELLSIYVHEFFHILQFTNSHVSQHLDSLLEKNCFTDQIELIKFYSQNLSYQDSIKTEYLLLSSYLKDEKSHSSESAKRVLRAWLALYDKRIKSHSNLFSAGKTCSNLKDVDSFWTFVEGTARYVESQFLLDPKLHIGARALKDDVYFDQFASVQGAAYTSLPLANRSLGKKYYYSIGAHLSFILDIIEKKAWKKEAFKNSNWLVGAVKTAVK